MKKTREKQAVPTRTAARYLSVDGNYCISTFPLVCFVRRVARLDLRQLSSAAHCVANWHCTPLGRGEEPATYQRMIRRSERPFDNGSNKTGMYTDVTGRTPRAVALSVTMGQRIELKARAKVSQEGADITD